MVACSFPGNKASAKAPLNTHHKDRRHNNPAFHTEIIGEIILQAMIEVGRKTDAGDFFGGAVGAGIPAVAEGIKEKFPGIGIHPFQYPAGIVFQPVAAHAESQAAIVKAVFHRSDQHAVF